MQSGFLRRNISESKIQILFFVMLGTKEQKAVYDAFTVSAEDREECMESTKKKEETTFDYRLPEDYKMKEIKSTFKDRRSTQDEADAWTFGASEGDQEVMDTMCQLQESSGMWFI